MAKKVLIAGASGLIGTRLTEVLLQKGVEVAHLGRRKKSDRVPFFSWNVERGIVDPGVLSGVDGIVNLSGAGIADQRWSSSRKREILDSRVHSTALLHRELSKGDHHVRTFISASAIGFYGLQTGNELIVESHLPGKDFLAEVVKAWEEEAEKISALGLRVVELRTGIVLSKDDGALKAMAAPVKLGLGAILGDGDQFVSWIHIDDLCEMYCLTLENDAVAGPYNAVAPQPVSNVVLTRIIAKVLRRPLWMPPIPAFLLRLILGEMANLVIFGCNVSSEKIYQTGFRFQFSDLEIALRHLYKRKLR